MNWCEWEKSKRMKIDQIGSPTTLPRWSDSWLRLSLIFLQIGWIERIEFHIGFAIRVHTQITPRGTEDWALARNGTNQAEEHNFFRLMFIESTLFIPRTESLVQYNKYNHFNRLLDLRKSNKTYHWISYSLRWCDVRMTKAAFGTEGGWNIRLCVSLHYDDGAHRGVSHQGARARCRWQWQQFN